MTESIITKGKAEPMDHHVGKRIKMRRILLGLSQQDLGKAAGVSIQQIQKYEKATNRVSSGKLFVFSELLKVPISYFFETDETSDGMAFAEELHTYENEESGSARDLINLMRSFNEVKDHKARKTIIDVAKSMRGIIIPDTESVAA